MKTNILFISALLISVYANAQICFQNHIISTDIDEAESVFAADLDGDIDILNGLYFIKLQDSELNFSIKKFIKN